MAILHGIWLKKQENNCLFIWGESWRTSEITLQSITTDIDEVPLNPLAMTPTDLREWLAVQK